MRDCIITRDSSDCLQHFGIKGQKWGIRRFENPDGTLTAEGYKRYYGKRFEKESRKQQRLDYKADQAKQVRIAEEQKSKAKRSALVGLAGAGIAGGGYLETAIAKGMNGGKLPLAVENVAARSKGITTTQRHAPKGMLLGASGLVDMSVGGATAVIGLGKAAYHGIRASVANRRASIAGHEKAAEKARKHLEGMRALFENTPYTELIKARFE